MIIWKNVRHNLVYLLLKPIPVSARNTLAEAVASLLPQRVIGWCLLRACKHYNMNEHLTLISAARKFSKKPEGFRGVHRG